MSKCLSLVFVLLFAFSNIAYAKDIEISAQCAAVADAYTKTFLYEKNSNVNRSVASTTKIMTCLLACESGRLGDTVVINDEMLNGAEGSLIYLETGDKISLYDLVCGAMIASGNDAANAIAVYLSGSIKEFALKMNAKADELSMKSTKFVTPSGLDKGCNHSTAYDMALLTIAALENEALMKIASMKSAVITVSGEKREIYNHNKLLSYSESFIGMKTGYTRKAGRCLISCYKYGKNVIVTVTLNAPDDWEDHKILVNYCKKCYKDISQKQNVDINAVGGEAEKAKCSFEFKVKALQDIKIRKYYYPFVYAPVSQGDILGRADIYIGNKLIESVSIKAEEDIKRWQIMR